MSSSDGKPRRYLSKPTAVDAMQWNPGFPGQTGAMVGWLLASGQGFTHPSGEGATTTIHLDGDYRPLEPGGWVLEREDGRFYTMSDQQFRDLYDVDGSTR